MGIASVAHAQTAVTPPGDGLTTATAYQITELGNLVWMGDTAAASSGKYYELMNDIDASDTTNWNDAGTTTALVGFPPIGTYSFPDTTSFRGVFDGQGHKITGLTIDRPAKHEVGLFGFVGSLATLERLGLENCSVTGGVYVSELAGYSNGAILNCYTSGTVTGTNLVGGLAGYNGGAIANCHAIGAATASGVYAGGLAGSSDGTIANCYASGTVAGPGTASKAGGLVGGSSGAIVNCNATATVTGNYYAGGMVGGNDGAITNCYATATVTGSAVRSGGLVGGNSGAIANCHADGTVAATASDSDVGGLVGGNSGPITNSYASGTVIGTGSASRAGGLAGASGTTGTIVNCYATGTVTGNNYAGGLVGGESGTVADCYATGSVSGNNHVGGLVGGNSGAITDCYAAGAVTGATKVGGLVGANSGTVTDGYWDTESSGQATSAGGTGENTAQMKQQATFQPGGGTGPNDWDFTTIWAVSATTNGGYPYLQAPQPVLSFVSQQVKSSHTETWNHKTQSVASKDSYSFSATIQLPASFALDALNANTPLEVMVGGVFFEQTLGQATKKNLNAPDKGGSATFTLTENVNGKPHAVQTVKVSWTNKKVLKVTLTGTPPAGNGPVVNNIVNLRTADDGAVSPQVSTYVGIGTLFGQNPGVTSPGAKKTKTAPGTDTKLVSWSVSGKY